MSDHRVNLKNITALSDMLCPNAFKDVLPSILVDRQNSRYIPIVRPKR